MTATQRTPSRLAGAALARAIDLDRSGEVLAADAATALYRDLTARPALMLDGRTARRVYTGGGAVVTFTPIWGGYAVGVSASTI